MNPTRNAMSWEELAIYAADPIDQINGLNNPYSSLRLFNKNESEAIVTLYRDNHAWCPYCQKVWIWLELKNIPYRIKKVTMRCYGEKERWYLKKVPSGMLPAIEIENHVITESDEILFVLEEIYGPLGQSLNDNKVLEHRRLERELFSSWCNWLCRNSLFQAQEEQKKENFKNVANKFEKELQKNASGWLTPVSTKNGEKPGSADVIFIPYVERMNASLAYYKGYSLRDEHPIINTWLKNLEKLEEYRGTQGDFHTHAHDLPPQMGGCFTYSNKNQQLFAQEIDIGSGLGQLELVDFKVDQKSEQHFEALALERVIKHKERIVSVSPMKNKLFDQPLRAALTSMISKKDCRPEENSASALRYLRDRISVPRDMPLLSGRLFRQALERTANIDGSDPGPEIPTRNRLDQNPIQFN